MSEQKMKKEEIRKDNRQIKFRVNLNQVAKSCNSKSMLSNADLEKIQKNLAEIEKGLIGLWERL